MQCHADLEFWLKSFKIYFMGKDIDTAFICHQDALADNYDSSEEDGWTDINQTNPPFKATQSGQSGSATAVMSRVVPFSETGGETSSNITPVQSTSVAATNLDCQALAQQFVQWYYKVVNKLISPSPENSSEWGPQHFWLDSKLSLLMISGQTSHDDCQGSLAVSEKLHKVVKTEKLQFNPFVEGVKGQMNAYGLVRVTIGGTVLRFSQCIGIFEQSFGLIQDPNLNNNWKIKFTELKMKAGENQIEGQPVPAIGSS